MFDIPDWESIPTGDKSAKELINKNVRKLSKKRKIKNNSTSSVQELNKKKNKSINVIDKSLKVKHRNVQKGKESKLALINNKKPHKIKDKIIEKLNEQKLSKFKKKKKRINDNLLEGMKINKEHMKLGQVEHDTSNKNITEKFNKEMAKPKKKKNKRNQNKSKFKEIANEVKDIGNNPELIDIKKDDVSKIKKIQCKTENSNKDKIMQKLNKKKLAKLKKKNKQIENIKTKFNENEEQGEIKELTRINLKNINKNSKMKNIENKRNKLINMLNIAATVSDVIPAQKKSLTLREKMMEKLKASRFRYLNEQLYNSEGKEAQKYFNNDSDAFHAYHDGYRQQVEKWPMNPLNVIIKSIKKMPADYVIADFGCGDANLAKSVSQEVHSFDFVATNECVTPCNMSHTPLENESVNVAVFCLSLMGTNIKEYLYEANRVLKIGGKLKIADVESRFDTVEDFIEGVKKFGFNLARKDLSHNLFYFLDFLKISKCKPLSKLPTISLHPCLYKKR